MKRTSVEALFDTGNYGRRDASPVPVTKQLAVEALRRAGLLKVSPAERGSSPKAEGTVYQK